MNCAEQRLSSDVFDDLKSLSDGPFSLMSCQHNAHWLWNIPSTKISTTRMLRRFEILLHFSFYPFTAILIKKECGRRLKSSNKNIQKRAFLTLNVSGALNKISQLLRCLAGLSKKRNCSGIHGMDSFTQRSYISSRIWRKYFIPSSTDIANMIEIINVPMTGLRLTFQKLINKNMSQNHGVYQI